MIDNIEGIDIAIRLRAIAANKRRHASRSDDILEHVFPDAPYIEDAAADEIEACYAAFRDILEQLAAVGWGAQDWHRSHHKVIDRALRARTPPQPAAEGGGRGMVAFNFRAEFAPLIVSGVKFQTIRATVRCAPGNAMQLFTGMRTKSCVKILDARCVLTDYVHIDQTGITFGDKSKHPDCDTFARWDGFDDLDDMRAWFRNTYETEHFIGYVHRWARAEATP